MFILHATRKGLLLVILVDGFGVVASLDFIPLLILVLLAQLFQLANRNGLLLVVRILLMFRVRRNIEGRGLIQLTIYINGTFGGH